MKTIRLLLENILPVRQITESAQKSQRYETILASLKVVGLVEPLVVFRKKASRGNTCGERTHAPLCDERIWEDRSRLHHRQRRRRFHLQRAHQRLPAIQEHKMISRAVKNAQVWNASGGAEHFQHRG